MPLYKNIGRGPLILSKTEKCAPGKTCEMSEKDAASLPPGIVELVETKKPEPVKPESTKAEAPKGK